MREHSLIGASLSSIADVESDYRFLVTGSYLTFYRVLDNDVYVDLSLIHISCRWGSRPALSTSRTKSKNRCTCR